MNYKTTWHAAPPGGGGDRNLSLSFGTKAIFCWARFQKVKLRTRWKKYVLIIAGGVYVCVCMTLMALGAVA